MNSDELSHWGIRGQKWGERRFQNKDGSLTPAGVKRYADQAAGVNDNNNKTSKATEVAPKKTSKTMTNEELKTAITRIKLEQEYNKLTYSPSAKSIVAKFATKVFSDAGKDVATKATKALMIKTINNMVGEEFISTDKKKNKDKDEKKD